MTKQLSDYVSGLRSINPDIDRELAQAGSYIDLAIQIRRLREGLGLSQAEVASRVGTTQGNIARWETPGYQSYTIKSLERLSSALGQVLKIELASPDVQISKNYNWTDDVAPRYIDDIHLDWAVKSDNITNQSNSRIETYLGA